jgi:thymidylate synthase (FAD)
MIEVCPEIYPIAQTELNVDGLEDYFLSIDNPEWRPNDAISSAENLSEFAGRTCYRSFEPYNPEKPLGTNKNVIKVREGNKSYLGNILEAGHGSTLEHSTQTFVFANVSRILEAELIRHRAGMAYSIESGRFIWKDDILIWIPDELSKYPHLETKFKQIVADIECFSKEAYDTFNMPSLSMVERKKVTSLIRRLYPQGMATNIVITGNHRSWRHIISMRGSTHAEDEIRIIANKLGKYMKVHYPNIYQDLIEDDNGNMVFTLNSKV